MRFSKVFASLLAVAILPSVTHAQEGNLAAPAADTVPMDLAERQSPWGRWNIDIDHKDRVYSAGAPGFVSVTDPSSNTLLGVIALPDGEASKAGLHADDAAASPSFGYAPNGRTLAVASQTSGHVTFFDTQTNAVVHTADVGGSPVGASYTPNGKEVWIPIRGENYISVLDAKGYGEIARLRVAGSPGMTIFSNNGRYAFVCSGDGSRTIVFDVRKRSVVGSTAQGDAACSSIAASPDGKQIWLASMAGGKATAFSAKPPFKVLRVVDTGPGTNSVNFVSNDDGQFAYVSVAGLNSVKVIDTQSFENVATIPVGMSPSGVWPSGDGSRIYVGLNRPGAIAVIDTAIMRVVDEVRVGQAAQAVVYVPYAVRHGRGVSNLRSSSDGPTAIKREASADPRGGDRTG